MYVDLCADEDDDDDDANYDDNDNDDDYNDETTLGRHLVEVFWPMALLSLGESGQWPAIDRYRKIYL